MDKKIAALLGAAAALTTMTAANATSPSAPTQAASNYADLLNPVPDALNQLIAEDAARTNAPAGVQVAQIAVEVGGHHHHHHHHRFRRHRHHHHHGFLSVPRATV
ncbi:MAG TPA: hypothetical protein VGC38_08085 [Pseudolabrys sp.]